MVGLIALLIIALYIGTVWFLLRKASSSKVKIIVLLIAILIPAADVIAGRAYFSYLCNTQSGQFIYKTVDVGAEYLYKPGEEMKHELEESGQNYAAAKGGEIDREKLMERYEFPFSKKEPYSRIFHIWKRSRVIKDKISGENLSESVSFIYYGGWVVNIYPYGIPAYCKDSHKPSSRNNIHARLFDRTFIVKGN